MSKCWYIHPEKICNIYLNGGKCESSCPDCHPKLCKWIQNGGCKRQNYVYLHTQEALKMLLVESLNVKDVIANLAIYSTQHYSIQYLAQVSIMITC